MLGRSWVRWDCDLACASNSFIRRTGIVPAALDRMNWARGSVTEFRTNGSISR